MKACAMYIGTLVHSRSLLCLVFLFVATVTDTYKQDFSVSISGDAATITMDGMEAERLYNYFNYGSKMLNSHVATFKCV